MCITVQVHAADLSACKVLSCQVAESSLPDDTPLSTIKETDTLVLYQLPAKEKFEQMPSADAALQVLGRC